MIPTLSLNPAIFIHVLALFAIVMIACYIIFPSDFQPKSEIGILIWKFMREVNFGIASIFGILFVDCALLWLGNAWTFVDWRFQLPSAYLLLYFGLLFVLYPNRNGNLLRIIFTIGSSITLLYFLHGIVSHHDLMGEVLKESQYLRQSRRLVNVNRSKRLFYWPPKRWRCLT